MLIPIEILRKYVDIDVSLDEFVKNFSLKSAEVDSFGPFCNVKGLVIGKILEVKDHPDSNHLHITKIDTKDEILDIVCGAPNVEVGRKVIVAKNGTVLPELTIKKAVIRGVESNGMNCALEELGIDHKFQGYDGIYYLDDDAPLGEDPIKYLHLDDSVLEIELTPNRTDLLSIIGVAYDTKAMLNSKMHLEFEKAKEVKGKGLIQVSTETENCYRYLSKVIKDVEIKESPSWLKGALMKMNIRPINNVVDVTNYVLMVTGQPLHAFDYDQIKTGKIVVKMAKDNEVFTTLDHQDRVLTKDDIVITDGEKPLCLGGVMGGLNSEVEPTTKNIFLEAALFNPKCIKETSKRLGLSSESSMRFEKGINPRMTEYALNLASKLFSELANGKVLEGGSSFDNYDESLKEVKVSLDKINQVVGRNYTIDEVSKVFDGLSFEYELKNNEYKVFVPKRRSDIEGYQDLIEEVVRIDGYDKIEMTIPLSKEEGHLSEYQKFIRRIRHILSFNMNETLTYSLTTLKKATYFDNQEYELVKVMNPLVDDKEYMRHSTLPSLLDVEKYNINRKNENIFLFEMGRRYTMDSEEPLLSGVLSGTISETLWKMKKEDVDFFYVKGLIENLFNRLNIKNYKIELPKAPLKGMHPGVSASILIGTKEIGFFGKLHPETIKEFDIPDTYVFELSLKELFSASHPLKTIKEISKYPSVSRDLALVMDKDITSEYVINEIKRASKRSLTNVKVFDLYTGDKIASDKKQLALNLTFQEMDRTLETVEVDELISKILKHLESLGISLRE